MGILKMFFPKVKKVGIIYSKKFNQQYIEQAKKETEPLQIEIIDKVIEDSSEAAAALNELLPKIDILWVISDPIVLESKESVLQVFKIAEQQQKQVYAYSDVYIQYGAVLSVSYDAGTTGRQAASLLKFQPSERVQPPLGTEISLNMCLIDKLKIDFNKDSLSSVNNMINCNQ
jgi:putative ABC transport system substrate-binding protein